MDAFTFSLLVLLCGSKIQENTGKFPDRTRKALVAFAGLFSKVPPSPGAALCEKALC